MLTKDAMPLKLPYGIRDFNKLISRDYTYLDRTDRIAVLENLGDELLFLRPRRFGKSLWLSTLINYYDVDKTNDFERLFGNLAVGQNPTPLHNQYLVMKWDFSVIRSLGTIEQIEEDVHARINVWISNLAAKYRDVLPEAIQIYPNSLATLDAALAVINRSPYKLYLFIDEYDNFANEIMMGQQGLNQQRYFDLVSSEGMFKTLFKNLKAAGSGDGLERVFMTGVSPIVMNDITSGANVAKSITWHPYLNDLCGFREEEVRYLTQKISSQCGLSDKKIEEALEQLRIFYDGSHFISRFSGGDIDRVSHIYNPILTFYFLEELQAFCLYPEDMLDANLTPDYHKLVYISGYAKGEQILLDALNEQKRITVSDLGDRWGVKDMLDPDQQRKRLATLLCYLGALTIGGKTTDGEIILEIPNLVMRKLYAERILKLSFKTADQRDEAHAVARHLFAYGDIEPLCTFVEKHLLRIYDNRDYKDFNELNLKTLFIALLHYNNLYIMDSEPALLRRYGDLMMLIRPEMRHYQIFDLLIEFKYIPLNKLGMLTGQDVRQKKHSELANLDIVKEHLTDAQTQLRAYRQTLKQKYGDILKLRTYTVLAIGFDCLLWEEVSEEVG